MVTQLCALLILIFSPLQQTEDVGEWMLGILNAESETVSELAHAGLAEHESISIRGRLEDAPYRSLTILWHWQLDEKGRPARVPVKVQGKKLGAAKGVSAAVQQQSFVAPVDVFFLYAADYSEGSFYLVGTAGSGDAETATVEFYPNDRFHEINIISPGTGGSSSIRYDFDLRKAIFTVDTTRRHIVECRLFFNALTFTDIEELNILPSFISDRLEFFEFDDVAVHVQLQEMENGRWLPVETTARAEKKRKDYIVQVSMHKMYLPRPQDVADTGIKKDE